MDDMPEAHKSQPSVEIFVCTIKHRDSFQQAPLDQLHATLADLLDLSKDDDDLAYPYNESVLEARLCSGRLSWTTRTSGFAFGLELPMSAGVTQHTSTETLKLEAAQFRNSYQNLYAKRKLAM